MQEDGDENALRTGRLRQLRAPHPFRFAVWGLSRADHRRKDGSPDQDRQVIHLADLISFGWEILARFELSRELQIEA